MTQPLPSPARSSRGSAARLLLAWLLPAFLLSFVVSAQAQETGSITGRVFKPGTGEYVRDAEVRLSGTDQVVGTDREGNYTLINVPAGSATVTTSFTGYKTATATVTVAAGETATQNFDLHQSGLDETVVLEKYQVNAIAEGQAKAIQNQRRSMLIGEHVSSDEFGDVVEGNVGEFLKHLPGVDLEYVQFDARGPRMRGLDPQYVGVTMDGVKLASADAFNATVGSDNQGTEGSRAFGFESISLSNVDAVEVFKNLSADLDADAPAGAINLRSKRAFDRPGRRVSYSVSASASSEEFHLNKTSGPLDDKQYKARPSGSFEYSDVFFKKRLGIVFTYNNSSLYNEFQQFSMTTVNRAPTATDPRLAVPQTLTFTDGPKISDRVTYGFRFDYKLSPTFSFGVNTTLSNYHAYWDNRQFRFVTSTNNATAGTGRQTVLGEDPMIRFTTSSATGTSLTLTGDGADKFTDSISVLPSFDWKPTKTLTIEGRFGWSESDNQYRGTAEGKARSTSVNPLAGIQYTAERSAVDSGDWVLTQTGGSDWGNVANYLNPRISEEGRSDYNEIYTGGIDATWKKPVFGLPAFFKTGIRSREEYRKFTDLRNWLSYSYIGPGGGPTGSFASIPLTDPINLSGLDSSFASLSGLPPGFADRSLAANSYNEHPEHWIPNAAAQTPDNYYSAFIANNRNIKERVDAAFLMGNIAIKKLQLQAGVRFEKTTDELTQPTRRTTDELTAAGFPFNPATGRATTIPGLQYQFQSLPAYVKETEYDHTFLSAAAKYPITTNLIAMVGVHEAIRRPELTALSGVTQYNETNLLIQAPNPGLLPEESTNVSAKLSYYLSPTGSLSVGVFQIDVDGLFMDTDYPPGTWEEEFPDIDPIEYADYTVRTRANSNAKRTFRGMEIEYRESLTFLPSALRRSSIYASYLRNYADVRRGGMAPHQFKLGGTLNYKRFTAGADLNWTDDTPWGNAAGAIQYRGDRMQVDVRAQYVINRWATLVVSARDLNNVGQELFEFRNGREEMTRKDIYGTMWTFSVKGLF
jgi:iron complex outermembrane receptor protein